MKRIVCLLVMLAAVGLAAFGQFNRAINVSNTPTGNSRWPEVAFGNDGILHIVWAEWLSSTKSFIMYATYDGTTISEPKSISNPGEHTCYYPFIAMNLKGVIAVIWIQGNATYVAIYDPVAKVWGDPELVADTPWANAGLSKPKITVDPDGNVFTYSYGGYKSSSRAKINGSWEGLVQLNTPGVPSKEGGICATPDGKIWVVYALKSPGYKVAFKTRTKDTPWSNGDLIVKTNLDQFVPFISPGIDNIPYTSFMSGAKEGANYINLTRMTDAPRSNKVLFGPTAFHYPRVVVDSQGLLFIATQFGQGDHGLGIQYFTNESGDWKAMGFLPNSGGWPKLPGVAREAYGNIAFSYDSYTEGFKEAFITTRYPVVVKHFYPPTNLALTISYSGIMSGSPSATYSLSWSKNSENNDQYIRGYKLYKKVADGAWEFVIEVDKDTLSYDFVFSSGEDSPLNQKTQFGISTVSTAGLEGDRAIF